MTYSPTVNPYPDNPLPADTGMIDFDCSFPDHLDLRFYPKNATAMQNALAYRPQGRDQWHLLSDFRFLWRPEGEANYRTITAPRGMITDLCSSPEAVWSIVGPIGEHLEASIIHDYLFMAWTDWRTTALRQDFDFANHAFFSGMVIRDAPKRDIIYPAVTGSIGWGTFSHKEYTFTERMREWERLL